MTTDPRAVSYLRVSGLGQVGKDGIPRQRLAIDTWAMANSVRTVQEFEEPGVSGAKTIDDRVSLPGLVALLETDPSISHLLIERSDRLARDLMVSEFIFKTLREIRPELKVIACDSGIDLADDSDPTRKLIRQILAAFSEFEKDSTVARLRAARMRIKAETGKCEGRKPFGATPEQTRTMEVMTRLRAEGAKLQPIARELNERGHMNGNGRPWTEQSVSRQLLLLERPR